MSANKSLFVLVVVFARAAGAWITPLGDGIQRAPPTCTWLRRPRILMEAEPSAMDALVAAARAQQEACEALGEGWEEIEEMELEAARALGCDSVEELEALLDLNDPLEGLAAEAGVEGDVERGAIQRDGGGDDEPLAYDIL